MCTTVELIQIGQYKKRSGKSLIMWQQELFLKSLHNGRDMNKFTRLCAIEKPTYMMTSSTDYYCLEVHNEKTLKWKSLLAIVLFSIAGTSIIVQLFSKIFWASFRPFYLNVMWGF
jgi:hypothetical protein